MKIRSKVGEPRESLLTIRVNQDEKDALKQLAADADTSVGAYLLGLALGNDFGKAEVRVKPDPRQMRIDV